jgi:hypothetical protein
MLLGILLFGLLVMDAYMLRLTPEVVNCDRGRQIVIVKVNKAYPGDSRIFRRESGHCNVWFYSSGESR